MRELALFAGAGGGILGGRLLGWRTVCAVELDSYARNVLLTRQADGCLDRFPIWDDVRTFDGKPWHGRIDVISGGFPCQDISAAGKGAGITGARSGLWKEMARIVGEVRPQFVFVENSNLLVSRGLAVVLGDLADLGYDARWGVLGAHHVGAPHKRHRLWIVAHTSSRWRQSDQLCSGWDKSGLCGAQLANTNSAWEPQSQGGIQEQRGRIGYGGENVEHSDLPRQEWTERSQEGPQCSGRGMPRAASLWDAEPNVGRVANGVARRVDRLRALGNGQVPAVAALAWRMLSADPSGYPDN